MQPVPPPDGTGLPSPMEPGGQVPGSPANPGAPQQPEAGPEFVYALGQVEPRFSGLALEKEFAQVVGRMDTAGQTDRQVMQSVLGDRANRYLVRQLCWTLTIEGLETYLLVPRDPAELDLLVESVRGVPSPTDIDVVIGLRGPIAPPEACNGLMIPFVAFDQLYSFDRAELLGSVPRPEGVGEDDEQFRATASELFDRIMQVADNAGASDEHRAMNYLAVRYPAIYAKTAEAHNAGASLTAVTVSPSRLSGVRDIVDVVFAFSDRRTDVTEKYFVRVDVTEEFPFLVTKLAPYYERV